jgi:hypothetical protein
MPQHYTKNTVQVTAYCSVCGRMTPHRVFDGRLSGCMNDHHPAKPAPEKDAAAPPAEQGELFR